MMAWASASVSAVPLLGLPPTNCTPLSQSNSSGRVEHQLLNWMGACVLWSQLPYTMRPYWTLGMLSSAGCPPLCSAPLASKSILFRSTSIHFLAVLLLVAAAAVASTSRMILGGCPGFAGVGAAACCGSKFPLTSWTGTKPAMLPTRICCGGDQQEALRRGCIQKRTRQLASQKGLR